MNKKQEPERIEIGQWPFRIQYPQKENQNRVMLLIHGHLGNENAMWVLAKPLPKDYYLLAPRAPLKMGENQYSWHEIASQWPKIKTYQDLAEQLITRVDHWIEEQNLDTDQFDIMGFSQGAVMAYALAFFFTDKVRKVAALAGFFPESWQKQLDLNSVAGKSFYIAHGTRDDIIPIEKAHQAAKTFEAYGADITFCEADIGHKLSTNCFKGLGQFFD